MLRNTMLTAVAAVLIAGLSCSPASADRDVVITSHHHGQQGTGKSERGKLEWAMYRAYGTRVFGIRTTLNRPVRYRCEVTKSGGVIYEGRVGHRNFSEWYAEGAVQWVDCKILNRV